MSAVLALIIAVGLIAWDSWTFDKYLSRPRGLSKGWVPHTLTWLKFLSISGLLFLGLADIVVESLWWLAVWSFITPIILINLWGRVIVRVRAKK